MFSFFHFLHADVPKSPVDLRIKEKTRDTVVITWQPPTDDGGSAVTGYVIEKREAKRATYTNAGSVNADKRSFELTRLTEGTEYMIRVAAKNEIGTGEFAELGSPVIPKSAHGRFPSLSFCHKPTKLCK